MMQPGAGLLVSIILPALLGCVLSEMPSLPEKAEIIHSVAHHFHLNSVFPLEIQGEGIDYGQSVVKIRRYLSGSRIFTFSYLYPDTMVRLGVLNVMLSTEKSEESLRQVNFSVPLSNTVWLAFMDSDSSVEELFINIAVPFDCEFLVAQEEDGCIIITEVYHINAALPLQTCRIGNWSSHIGMSWSSMTFYQRRRSLQNTVFRAGVLQGPATSVFKGADGKIMKIGSYIGHIWNILQGIMNFSTSYYTAADSAFGVEMVNGRWNGLLGMIDRKEIDVISTDILMDRKRLGIVNFMNPLFEVRTYMFIRSPKKSDMDWENFLKPFSTGLWMAILGVILVLSVFYFIGIKVCRKYNEESEGIWTFRLYDSVFYIYYSFCQQAQSDPVVYSTSCRVLSVTTYLTAVVLLVGYSGFLISYLTFRTTELPFTSFGHFLQAGTHRLGVLSNSTHYVHFKESTNPNMQQLFLRYIFPNKADHPKSFLEGLQRVCSKERYSFMAPVFIANGFLKELPCDLVAIPEAYIPATATLAIEKRSPFQGLFSHKSGDKTRLPFYVAANPFHFHPQSCSKPCYPCESPALIQVCIYCRAVTSAAVLTSVKFEDRQKQNTLKYMIWEL
ncbi:glutamate receptor ionotropic, kainate 4-like [Zootermopsis nevadensis]|uniref:glutamate receptor ionotropic, kainate 4-like n=1 Tax=Zootermopsis nevadensis TaxID=136037 RepID=UPI000B8EB361|nr:glutamate receptor ionotropic, kainate 4-like [Zootermopsis nevadensis]